MNGCSKDRGYDDDNLDYDDDDNLDYDDDDDNEDNRGYDMMMII